MRVTLSIACYGRPQRTRRIIDCVLAQTAKGWEALIIGDGCPVMQEIIDSRDYEAAQAEAERNGNRLVMVNLPMNMGGHGYHIHNTNIHQAKGAYFCLAANDDIILPEHLENYTTFMEENPILDFAYFPSRLGFNNSIRATVLSYGSIGHSELIVKTEFAKKMPPHGPEYGHDWTFISNLLDGGAKHQSAFWRPATYIVMGTPACREAGID